jgi:hypothetical protein
MMKQGISIYQLLLLMISDLVNDRVSGDLRGNCVIFYQGELIFKSLTKIDSMM